MAGLLVAIAVAGCGASGSSGAPSASGGAGSPAPSVGASTSQQANAAGAIPAFGHVYVIVLENEEYSSLVGSAQAPFLNSLITKYAVAKKYYGVAHPSQPNYIALFSGSTQNVTSDGKVDLSGQNLADQLEAKGKTWAVFAQGYPGGCFAGSTAPPQADGPGEAAAYARKHNPAMSFTDISSSPTRCDHIKNLGQFDPAAADFELIVPNLCNDMHSCPISKGDAFLSEFVPTITGSPAFSNSALFITTDEGSTDQNGGGQILTVVVSSLVKPGFSSMTQHNHYSLLRTIEDAWGLGCLNNSCSANNLSEFFH